MIKQAIKNSIAKTARSMVRLSVKRGFMKQDDVVEKLSHYEQIDTDAGKLTFFCPGDIPIWRARTFYSKEPETLEWIKSFEKDDTLLDVGANVGLYTVYAAKKGHQVWAIEPLVENYFILQKNIFLNKVNNAFGYCLCLYDENKIDSLKIRNPGFGQAQNSFHESLGAYEEIYDYKYQQGVVGLTLDYFVQQCGVPNHIKLDVDGHELKVLKGASKTLENKNVKSLLVEMNEEGAKFKETCDAITGFGFEIADKSHSELMNNDKYQMFKNYIFRRP